MGLGRVCRLRLHPGQAVCGLREGMPVMATSWPNRVGLGRVCRLGLVKTSPTDGVVGQGKSACILFMFS